MLGSWTLIIIALAYMALLFLIAWVGDKRRIARDHRNVQAIIYSLSLAVYCTSWTFFGAVGSAATTGLGYLPIYIGPALMMLLGFDLLKRVAQASHEHRITSIADYIAFRYGRSHTIAVLVTLAAVIGSVPYIALQLKGIMTGLDVIAASSGNGQELPGLSFYLSLALALFAILFGTRTLDASEHHRGLMWAIAFESVVKLMAFIAVGLFVIYGFFGGFSGIAETMQNNLDLRDRFSPWQLPQGFIIQTVLAMVAILCLPRQFHVAIVEFRSLRELSVARWLFPAYLAIFAFLVIPITLAGLIQFDGEAVHPDTFVLALPLAADQPLLTVLAFIGGFSAATGMVIVATVALAIMISNDIVMPMLLRSRLVQDRKQQDLSQTLLRVRRISILAVTLVAYLYYQAIESGVALASIGLLSFSAAAQFAPAIVAGVYWRGASRAGALSGLSVGIFCWLILLMLPSLTASLSLPFLPSIDFNTGASLSLALNVAALVLVSLLLPDDGSRHPASVSGAQGMITVGDLEATVGRFLGRDSTHDALATYLESPDFEATALATPATIQFGERLLAGSIGTASARTVLTAALHRQGLGPEAVMDLLDRASRAVQFNRELLESTLDNMSQGVAVIDKELTLVGWNRRYLQLMDYPEGLVHLGQSIEELLAFNAQRGLLGSETTEVAVKKRLAHLRQAVPYRYEREWLDDRVIEIRGNPMPGGGYVTTYSDITHFKEIESKLKEINETLEQRVKQRTMELSDAIENLDVARQQAVDANQSKTRFLAAASHDLLQPMNAARLFLSILRQQADESGDDRSQLISRVDRSLTAAEELLGALLDISKFDSGRQHVDWGAVDVQDLFDQLSRRFRPLAENRGLTFRTRSQDYSVLSDRNLLYRILQNLISNAIRYTETGGVLLACQRRGDQLRISVWDTGVGFEDSETQAIFQEFHRLDYAQGLEEKGLGLGLAICERISRILKHPVTVRSRPGHGSCFDITVPITQAPQNTETTKRPPGDRTARLQSRTVLCIDNDKEILEGMRMLLERWGCDVLLASNRQQAIQQVDQQGMPDIVLADYHLEEDKNGLELVSELQERLQTKLQVIVITADRSSELVNQVQQLGFDHLPKPIKPAALRALMNNRLSESGVGAADG